MDKVAILVDGSYYKKCYNAQYKSNPKPDSIITHCNKLLSRPEFNNKELLRIFYYDCLPYDGKEVNHMTGHEVDYSQTEPFKQSMAFFNDLMTRDNIAFRKGHLQLNGWKIENTKLKGLIRKDQKIGIRDIKEDFKQKGVDMKIGLDIAWLATKKIVDCIILITGDTDFVPAMKFARREGVRVILNALMTHPSPSLREHADLTMELSPHV